MKTGPQIDEFMEFDRLRIQLTESFRNKNQKTAMFSGAFDKCGKTFLLFHLSQNFVYRTSRKLLLIDMNFRNPELHKYFGLKNKTGFIAGIKSFEDSLADGVIQKTENDNLDVIVLEKNNDIYIEPELVDRFIKTVSADYDFVFIDTSPVLVLNKNNLDPTLLSTIIDKVIFVILARRTQKDWVRKSIELFRNVGSNIDHVIMNYQFTPLPAIEQKGHVSITRIIRNLLLSNKFPKRFKKKGVQNRKKKAGKTKKTKKGKQDEIE